MTSIKRKKQILLKRLNDNDKCSLCGGRLTDSNSNLDHILPESKGGEGKLANMILVHKNCNQRKKNKILACQILHKYERICQFNYLLKRLKKLKSGVCRVSDGTIF